MTEDEEYELSLAWLRDLGEVAVVTVVDVKQEGLGFDLGRAFLVAIDFLSS